MGPLAGYQGRPVVLEHHDRTVANPADLKPAWGVGRAVGQRVPEQVGEHLQRNLRQDTHRQRPRGVHMDCPPVVGGCGDVVGERGEVDHRTRAWGVAEGSDAHGGGALQQPAKVVG